MNFTYNLSEESNPFKKMLFGFILIIASIALLSYNEHRSINQTLALEEMQEKIIHIESTPYAVQNEGKAVHIQGEVIPKKILEDKEFGIQSHALRLQREVFMYQWEEEEHTNSSNTNNTVGQKTYSYDLEWSSQAINSSHFEYEEGHENPQMPYNEASFSTDASLGEYTIQSSAMYRFPANDDYNGLDTMPEKVKGFTNHKTFLYKGENPNSPLLGDLKIVYTEASQAVYTLAGKVDEKNIVSYHTENDISLFFVREGLVSAEQIFMEAFNDNKVLTWFLRFAGVFLMFIGFMFILSLLESLGNFIPFMSTILGGISTMLAFTLTLVLSTVVIAVAWFAVRPVLSLVLIGAGLGGGFLLRMVNKKSQKEEGEYEKEEDA